MPTLFEPNRHAPQAPLVPDAELEIAPQRDSPDALARLLLVFPGPIYDAEDFFGERLTELSSGFTGVALTTGPEARALRVGRFDVQVIRQGGAVKGGEMFALMRAAARAVRGAAIDAVVTYDPLKSGIVGYCASRLARAPLIVEVNGDYTADANYVDIRHPLIRGLKRGVFVQLERFILCRAAGIKLLYPEQIRPFQDALGSPVVRTFPDFVPWTAFRDLGESPEILFAGFPYHLKGVDVLIAAFKLVAADFPEWRLKILGWFPDRRPLEAAIDGHPGIQIHPPVYRREMPHHMGRCAIFVLPSRTEAMGRVLVEAMACAKPCVGTRIGGIPRVIADGESGILVRPEDAAELADALRKLMSDSALRRRLGANGRRRVERDFSTSTYAGHVREFYQAVLKGTRAAQSVMRVFVAWLSSWVAASPEVYQPGLML